MNHEPKYIGFINAIGVKDSKDSLILWENFINSYDSNISYNENFEYWVEYNLPSNLV
jgi:hypothetical protein